MFQRLHQLGVFLFQLGLEQLKDFLGAFNVGAKIVQIGARKDFFLAGDFGGGNLVEQIHRPLHHQLAGHLHSGHLRAQLLDVIEQFFRRLLRALRSVLRPQDFFDFVEAHPNLVFFQIGLARVDARVQVAKALGNRLGAFVIHADARIQLFRLLHIARSQRLGKLARTFFQLVNLADDKLPIGARLCGKIHRRRHRRSPHHHGRHASSQRQLVERMHTAPP